MKVNYEPFDLSRLREFQVVSVDTETTGVHWYKDRAFGIAIAGYDGREIWSQYVDLREAERLLPALRKHLPQARRIVNHSAKFDAHFLHRHRVDVPPDLWECTMVRAALINEHEGEHGHDGFDLDTLCKKYVGEGKPTGIYDELAKMFGGEPTRHAQMKNLHRAPVRLAEMYAAPDPALAIRLWLWQEGEIERQGLQKIWALEKAVMPALIEIEEHGIRVDQQLAARRVVMVDEKILEARRKLNELAGKPVNANSPTQMRALFGTIKSTDKEGRVEWRTSSGFLLENTDGGEASINKDSLMVMSNLGDERAKAVLTIRRMTKGQQFLKDHILGHVHGDRVYPNYNQMRGESGLGTVTGRFSIDDPALQQIPMHDRDVAEIVRPCFLPNVKDKWGCADWKQFEFRWFAHYTNDPNILEMYRRDPNADFHQTTADLTGITRDRKYAGDTANAKQINLGLVFGMGEGEMAYNMGMDFSVRRDKSGRDWKVAGEKAKAVFAKYHAAIPGVRALLDQASSIARNRGYVKTIMDRHIRFPRGSYYKAGGLVFQGSSADSMKQKLVELRPVAKKEGFNILLLVHDEYDFSFPDAKRQAPVAKKILETFDGVECPIKCRVPILSDVSVGDTWWDACK